MYGGGSDGGSGGALSSRYSPADIGCLFLLLAAVAGVRFVRNNYIASADYKQSLETITTKKRQSFEAKQPT